MNQSTVPKAEANIPRLTISTNGKAIIDPAKYKKRNFFFLRIKVPQAEIPEVKEQSKKNGQQKRSYGSKVYDKWKKRSWRNKVYDKWKKRSYGSKVYDKWKNVPGGTKYTTTGKPLLL